jgi:hypothetical protein
MRRLVILVTAAVAATVVAGILSTSGGAQQPGERTFKIIEEEGGAFKFVDIAPKARNPRNPTFSIGDAFVFRSPLRTEANVPNGTLHVHCAVTKGGNFSRATSQCDGTFDLRDGTLAVTAVVKGEEASIAVVGGTRAYEGARGSITDRDLPRDRTEDTVHLLP